DPYVRQDRAEFLRFCAERWSNRANASSSADAVSGSDAGALMASDEALASALVLALVLDWAWLLRSSLYFSAGRLRKSPPPWQQVYRRSHTRPKNTLER